jgi:hypothetical protein
MRYIKRYINFNDYEIDEVIDSWYINIYDNYDIFISKIFFNGDKLKILYYNNLYNVINEQPFETKETNTNSKKGDHKVFELKETDELDYYFLFGKKINKKILINIRDSIYVKYKYYFKLNYHDIIPEHEFNFNYQSILKMRLKI